MIPARFTASKWIHSPFPLSLGGSLPQLLVNYSRIGPADAPIVYVMPSMSHSALVSSAGTPADSKARGWWDSVVGLSPKCGIDLNKYQVICASPLGSPYGSSSPVSPISESESGNRFANDFPLITPVDQAMLHYHVLKLLGIQHKLHAVIGASMGGMQALQFAALFPDLVERLIVLCTTGRTSPSTQALRSVQRNIVRSDPNWLQHGEPTQGLGIARAAGTIAYRSREEFDVRFSPTPRFTDKPEPSESFKFYSVSAEQLLAAHSATTESPISNAPHTLKFPVEDYLDHQSMRFATQVKFDANCWLRLSECMDMVR